MPFQSDKLYIKNNPILGAILICEENEADLKQY